MFKENELAVCHIDQGLINKGDNCSPAHRDVELGSHTAYPIVPDLDHITAA
ncbi:hypothetical protein OAF34_07235 [Pirellulaceae bacterium]|nr:hypothetical protein [Pirellulaceae bacterium]